jgi:hypothetical protein
MVFFVMPASMYVMLRSPSVQQWLCNYATNYLTKQLGTKVSVGGVNIAYFFDLVLEDVYIQDSHKNTLLYAPRIRADISGINTSKQEVNLSKVELDGAFIALVKYKNEKKLNLQHIVDFFQSNDTTAKKPKAKWTINVDAVKLTDTRFRYNDQNLRHPKRGMDYSYIDVSDIDLDIDHVSVVGEDVRAHIHHLRAREKCGFNLLAFTAEVHVNSNFLEAKKVHIKTPSSELDLDLKFSYSTWDDYNHFIEKVMMEGNVRKSLLNIGDIGYFAPELQGFNLPVEVVAEVAGRVDSLGSRNIILKYGEGTRFLGNAFISGLPDFKNSYFYANVHSLTARYNDIARLNIPDNQGGTYHPELPQELLALGNIQLEGAIRGNYHDFETNVELNCNLGNATAAVRMRGEKGEGITNWEGRVVTNNFNIGKLAGAEELVTTLSMDASVQGSGFTRQSLLVKMNGKVSNLVFKDYPYKNITVNGDFTKNIFNGDLQSRDPNLNLDFSGYIDFNDSIPVYDFSSNVYLARLNKLNLINSDSITDVSCDITSHLQGKTIDDLYGTLSVANASYIDGSQRFTLNSFKLTALRSLLNYRTFIIKSDYVDATFKGYFYFADLGNAMIRYINPYLPGVFFANDTTQKVHPQQDFNFDITFYNASPVLKYFVDDINVSPNTRLKGDFNSGSNILNFTFYSEEFNYKKTRFIDFSSSAVTNKKNILFTSNCERVEISDSARIIKLALNADINNDSIRFGLFWDNAKDTNTNSADINGYCYFTRDKHTFIGLNESQFILSDTLWNLYSGGEVRIDSMGINVPGIYLISHTQQLEIKGRASKNPNDKLRLRFLNFNLSDFDNITGRYNFDLDGLIDGYVDVSNLFNTPSFFSDLHVKRLGFNGSQMGDATISSYWDMANSGIRMKAEVLYVGTSDTSHPVIVDGYIFPESRKNNFDLNILVTNFKLVTLSRYMKGIATILSGNASGSFTLRGPFNDPELKGKASMYRTGFRIDYLNTVYGCAHPEVRFDKNSISFDNLVLLDQPYMDTAICSGRITHKNFKDWTYDISINPKKFLCLNTGPSQNELFYGTGFITGFAHITGNESDVKIELDAKTEKDSRLFIPMNSSSEVTENNFITFKSPGDKSTPFVRKKDYAGVVLDLTLNVTDDAEVQVIFDPAVGDRIRGRGTGAIQMNYTSDGKFLMNGEFVVSSGDYLFTFENVLNKRFNIEQGGSIRWNGDPYNADLKLTAIYKLKASLATLGFEQQGSVPVNCIIYMSGQLMNPTFTFGIDLPNMTDLLKSTYMSVIEQNMNYNFLTLLVVNSFYNPGVGLGGNNSQTAGNAGLLGKTSSEVLSNQMSNWLSQISKKVDIGINYRPGDQITQQEVELALSTQLFNDRVRIESNVGVGGGAAKAQTDNPTNIVGDVNVEVKLTDDTRLHVFNKSNQQDLFNQEAPYTQGVGVFYRREFNSFKELFQRKNKKKNKRKAAEPVPPSAGDESKESR